MISYIFLSVVVVLFSFLYYLFTVVYPKMRYIMGIIFGWLVFIGFLANRSLFIDFSVSPPRILFVIVPMVFLLTYCSFSSRLIPLIQSVSHEALVYVQSFRIGIECLFLLLYAQQIIPGIMTFHGRNFDILIGLTAPLIGYFCFTKNRFSKRIALIWNILGIVMLLNVVVHGLLSAPLPFQVFFTDPPNIFFAYFPYIWLPGFVVPSAIFFHILSIRKLRHH